LASLAFQPGRHVVLSKSKRPTFGKVCSCAHSPLQSFRWVEARQVHRNML